MISDRFSNKVSFLIAILALCFLSAASAKSNKVNIVNILTWWGYLDDESLRKSIEKECQCQISFDEYDSDSEFIDRINSRIASYDVLIFSDTVYEIAFSKQKDALTSKHLGPLAIPKYAPGIMEQYLKFYPPNVRILLITQSGFLYNTDILSIDPNDKIEDIFSRAKDKIVVLADDYHEMFKLVGKNPDQAALKKLAKDVKIVATNRISRVSNHRDFAFAYFWACDAISAMIENNNPKRKFVVLNQLAHITTDLVALNSPKKAGKCVFEALSRAQGTEQIARYWHGINAYGKTCKALEMNSAYCQQEQVFFENLSKLKWHERLDKETSISAEAFWQLTKKQLGTKLTP